MHIYSERFNVRSKKIIIFLKIKYDYTGMDKGNLFFLFIGRKSTLYRPFNVKIFRRFHFILYKEIRLVTDHSSENIAS